MLFSLNLTQVISSSDLSYHQVGDVVWLFEFANRAIATWLYELHHLRLKSHVADSNLARICSLVFKHWDWTSNGACYDKGTRIIIGWNHNDVDVVVITQDAQAIHTHIWLKAKRKEVFCSFIYAHNRYTQRRSLWRNLSMHKLYIRDRPWCLLGDFNAALFLEDSTASGANIDISMREFWDCVEEIEVMDVHRTGLQFTWNQKPKVANGILKKLDRIMVNMAFNDQIIAAHAIFRPYRVSDHSPSVLCLPTLCKVKPKPFKFLNVVAHHERFMEVVIEVWEHQISGFHIFSVVKKLKNLKKPIRKLLYEKGNLHANVIRLRTELELIQTLLDADPFNASLREAEAACVVEFNQAAIMEERREIDVVTNAEGVVFANDAVPDVFVSHYEAFLGLAGEMHRFNTTNLFKTCLNEQVATDMIRNVTTQEVKEALFSIGDDKSLGPDGNGNLLKELNHTIIALIPKELMHNYYLDRGTPRCAFKVDIQKAYDTVDWEFLREGKRGLRQGDPLSLYLFNLVMEVLTLMLQRRVQESQLFTYHRYCSKLDLINLCFADDLFLFAYGDVNSASIIKEALEEFKDALGLTPSLPKSMAYFCNVLNHIKLSILQILPFEEKGKSKVAWEVVCLPRKKGGLGIRRAGLTLTSKVRDVYHEGTWSWPQDLLLKYHFLTACQVLIVDSRSDGLLWRTSHGVSKPFSVAQVWSDIRPRGTQVDWYHVVWFASCIPRHAFNLWLVVRRKLKTEDLVSIWDVSDSLGSCCSLCGIQPDSHDHLFFECPFARDVWDQMKVIDGLDSANPNIYAIIIDLLPIASRRYMLSVVAKLVVAASAYFIWQEQNWRLFKKCKRTPHQICECIQASVRLKLMSCRLKKSMNGVRMARLWDLPEAIFV
ncbi:RNA-directed DNA polymerase, eukaryota, reverse transcriptase zinc-binding domain protein [Tanacetum coccineum]